jgi:hypothetical protein
MEGGSLHPARPATGGGSDASQSSTELLCPEEEEGRNGKLGWAEELRGWAGLMGYGQVSPLPYFFPFSFFSVLFYFLFSNF